MRSPALLLLATAAIGLAVSGCGAAAVEEGPPTEFVLRPDGIGPYVIGQPADEVIEGLSASIGGPSGDTDEPDSPAPVPDCGVNDVRAVSWGSLVLIFADRLGSPVFATWSYGFDPITGDAGDSRSLGLVTEEGIGLGSLRDEVMEAFGLRVQFDDDTAIDLSTFTVDEGAPEHLAGRMESTDPNARVQFLERVPGCEAP